jgi:hypothetical protein
MSVAHARRACALLGLVAALSQLLGCPGAQRRTTRFDGGRRSRASVDVVAAPDAPAATPAPPPLLVRTEDRLIEFSTEAGAVQLRATAAFPTIDGEVVSGPVVVIVPGASDVSRRGLRRGDGVTTYAEPVAVTIAWQEAFGVSGALSLAYDKRTCGPNDDDECQKNPQGDLDKDGPGALAKDVDAACAMARTLPGFDGRLILMAHGQGTQVALSSTCASEAAAIVLLSPIPRTVDAVIVDALLGRQARKADDAKKVSTPDQKATLQDEAVALRNLAATRQERFASMRSGKFASDARVDGATIGFWLGWMDLTARTKALMTPGKDKTVVVLAQGDLQLGEGDQALVQGLPAKKVVVIDADHHLLNDGALSPSVSLQVVDAVVDLLLPPAI